MPREKGYVYTVVTALSHLSVRSMAPRRAAVCCNVWACRFTAAYRKQDGPVGTLSHQCFMDATTSVMRDAVPHWSSTFFYSQLNDFSSQALGPSDFWDIVHNTLPCGSQTKQMRSLLLFSIINFFLVLVKTLQESNPAWHSMLPPTRNNISVWKTTDTNDFLLNFSFGTGTSHQAFRAVFQHLQNLNSFPFLAVGFQCNPPPQKQGASLCVRCELGEQDGCQMDLQIN